MKASVVITVFNRREEIRKCIDSLKNQDYPKEDYEIIVVDDGSTDNTFEIAYNEKIKVFRYMINRGLGGALNTGISAALLEDADIIVTFDADGQHDFRDISKLRRYLAQGASNRFEDFLKGDPTKVLVLF